MRMRLAFATLLAGSLVLGGVASAQAVPAGWDMIVTVRMDRVGADLVSAGPRAAGYPAELLRKQLVALGARLGGEARGVSVSAESYRPGDASATILKGSCGVDGLIDKATGRLFLAPIAQAFAGAPAPYTVRRMIVSFDGVVPTNRTLVRHSFGRESDLSFTGRLVGSSIEYDVDLRSQDASRLVVHEDVSSTPKPLAQRSGVDALTVALVALAVAAAGALVYCLILLLVRRPLSKS